MSSLWWKEIAANFSRDQKPVHAKISANICSGNLHPTENAFFRRSKGLEKNDRDRDWVKQRSGLRD